MTGAATVAPEHLVETQMANGVTVVTRDNNAPVGAVAAAISTGSRDEPDDVAGITHLLEHIAFDAPSPDGQEPLAAVLEFHGAEPNAITSREDLFLYARATERALLPALVAMTEALAARPHAGGLAANVSVVEQELAAAAASPRVAALEQVYMSLFPGSGLDRPVAGRAETLRELTGDRLKRYWHERVHPATICLVVVGRVPHDRVVATVAGTALARLEPGTWRRRRRPLAAPPSTVRRAVVPVRSEEAFAVVAARGVSYADRDRPALDVLAAALGGSTKSVFYEEFRLRAAVAYETWAEHKPLTDAGVFRAHVVTTAGNVHGAAERARRLTQERLAAPWSDDDLELARRQAASQFILGLEGAAELALAVARNRFTGGVADWSPEAYAARIEGVTGDDVARAGRRLLQSGLITVVAAPA